MALDYETVMTWPIPEIRQSYSPKDTMLYALALGQGADPLDTTRLRFVYEGNLQALPSMAVVLGYPGFWMQDPGTGIDWVKLLHGEQRVAFHAPLPASGTVIGRSRVARIIDKGANKGAIVVTERTLLDADSNALLATVEQVSFLRGNGGYSANGQPSDTLEPYPNLIGDTPPDAVSDVPTRADMALLYRLCADDNPVHADPEVARKAGFARPILHGLASYGVAGSVILHTWCGSDPARLKQLNVRFTSPVYPGETLRVESWRRGQEIGFRAWALERDVMVLNNGYARVGS